MNTLIQKVEPYYNETLERWAYGATSEFTPYEYTILEWQGNLAAPNACNVVKGSITTLGSLTPCPLRIIICPLDSPGAIAEDDMRKIAIEFQIPCTFLDERTYSVPSSFGVQTCRNGLTDLTWAHFMQIEFDSKPTSTRVEHKRPRQNFWRTLIRIFRGSPTSLLLEPEAQDLEFQIYDEYARQEESIRTGDTTIDNPAWTRSGFFLRTDRSETSSECVSSATLICFGASSQLEGMLRNISCDGNWREITEDPYIFFDYIFYDLYIQLEIKIAKFLQVYRTYRKNAIYKRHASIDAIFNIDFANLHKLADYLVNLSEAAEATASSLQVIQSYHADHIKQRPLSLIANRTQQALCYRRELFRSMQIRIGNLDKKVNNLINMFFHRIAQQDSATANRDSSMMKVVALITAFFLPTTTVATVYGTEFFRTEDTSDGGKKVVVDQGAWYILWISLPLVLALCATWYFFHSMGKRKFERRQKLSSSVRSLENS